MYCVDIYKRIVWIYIAKLKSGKQRQPEKQQQIFSASPP